MTLNCLSGKLTSAHLVNKTPTFFGTQNANAVFVRPLHLSLFSARWIQCTHLHPSSLGHFYIIVPSACRYCKRSLSFKFSPKLMYAFFFTNMHAIARPSYRIWRGVRVMKLLICCFASLLLLPPPQAQLSSSAHYSRTSSACVFPAVSRPHPRRAKL